MEKFTWYCFNKNDELVYQRIAEQTPNLKVIEEGEEKFIVFINDEKQEKRKIKLKINYLDFTNVELLELFSTRLSRIIKKAHHDAIENFSEKGPAEVVLGKSEEAIINSCLYKWSYNSENITILSCAAEFMYRYATEHVYENANKRTSLLFAIYILSYFNLYIKFDSKKYDASDWRLKLIELITDKHAGQDDESSINELSLWIEKRVTMNYNEGSSERDDNYEKKND